MQPDHGTARNVTEALTGRGSEIMSWPADAVAGPRPGSMARRPCPDIVLSAPDDRDASQVNHAPRLDARRRRKGNAQASGGSAPQHSPAGRLFKGPAGSPERPKHSPVRLISGRPHSGPSPPPRRFTEARAATARESLARAIAHPLVGMFSMGLRAGEHRVPGFTAYVVTTETDFRRSMARPSQKWRCFSGSRERPDCPRRFPANRGQSARASHPRPGAAEDNGTPRDTETGAQTGRHACSLDSLLAEAGPIRLPADQQLAARSRAPMPAHRAADPIPHFR